MSEPKITSPTNLAVYFLAVWGAVSGYFSIVSYTETKNWDTWQYVSGVFIIILISLAFWTYKLRNLLATEKRTKDELLKNFQEVNQKHQAIVIQFKEKQKEITELQLRNEQYRKDFSGLYQILQYTFAELITGQTVEQKMVAARNVLDKLIRRDKNGK